MAVLDRFTDAVSNKMLPKEQQIDRYVTENINRAEERLRPLEPEINREWEMWRGHQYAHVDHKGALRFLPTKTDPKGKGKRPWVATNVNNLLMDVVAHEVSAATQRVPSYEVIPTAVDPAKRSAAHTSQAVALYGYDKWRVRDTSVKAVTHAVVARESFTWPFFDTNVGPMIMKRDGAGAVGMGEIKMRVYGAKDVMWEPGVRFDDSYYHIVRAPMSLKQATGLPGFLGGQLKPDAQGQRSQSWGQTKPRNLDLVMIYHYLEQPTPTYPRGRWIIIANDRVICKDPNTGNDFPYPVPEGICLHKLSYITDPDNDRDMGLLQHLIDPQRIFNDAWNKIVEWKNLALNPQLFISPGLLQGQKITGQPGAVYQVADPNNSMRWREVPNLPQELFQIAQESNGIIARLAAQNDIPQQVEAGRAIQALIERDMARRQAFIAELAEWHSHIAQHALVLVQEFYTEPRLLRIKGRWNWQTIKDFKGAQLLGQVDVRVSPGSIEPRTKVGIEQKILAYADRSWLTDQQAMAAIEGGYGAEIISSFELDVGRITRVIERIKEGEEALFGTEEQPAPDRPSIDVATGEPLMTTNAETGEPEAAMEPDFMPRIFDNIDVQLGVIEDWMKTEEFEILPPERQAISMEIYMGMLNIKAGKDALAQAAVQQQAEDKGT
ncbi:MAG: hypothetical protein ACREBC_14935, partial [Pyrinomonadaceae bacterium]